MTLTQIGCRCHWARTHAGQLVNEDFVQHSLAGTQIGSHVNPNSCRWGEQSAHDSGYACPNGLHASATCNGCSHSRSTFFCACACMCTKRWGASVQYMCLVHGLAQACKNRCGQAPSTASVPSKRHQSIEHVLCETPCRQCASQT